MSSTLALYYCDSDTKEAGRREWDVWLGAGSVELDFVPLDVALSRKNNGRRLNKNSSGIAMFHTTYVSPANLLKLSAAYPNLVLIGISGTGLSGEQQEGIVYNVKTPVGKPRDAAFSDRLRIFIDDFARRGKVNFALLEPEHDEARLALRLLCEAWKATGGRPTGVLYGVTIYAPQHLNEWLLPFKKENQLDLPSIAEITAVMGGADIEIKAQAVFDAANGKGEIVAAVEAFLQATEFRD